MHVSAQPMTGLPIPLDAPAAKRRARPGDDGPFTEHSSLSAEERAAIIRRLRWLARLLDDAIAIPGTRISIGLDPIIGLAPGVGDAVSLAISAYIIYEGKRLGASRRVLGMMTTNVILDALSGTIPIIGDVVDMAFKANQRNLRLLGIEPAKAGESI